MEVAVVMVVAMVVVVMVEEGTVAAELKVVMVRAVVMGVAEIVVAMPMAVVMVVVIWVVIWVGGRAMVATELGVAIVAAVVTVVKVSTDKVATAAAGAALNRA